MTHVNKTLVSLHALDKAKGFPEMRGKKQIPVAEDDGNYITVGLKPNRGSPGIRESWPKKFGKDKKDQVIK
jgi:hypothetical protein